MSTYLQKKCEKFGFFLETQLQTYYREKMVDTGNFFTVKKKVSIIFVRSFYNTQLRRIPLNFAVWLVKL